MRLNQIAYLLPLLVPFVASKAQTSSEIVAACETLAKRTDDALAKDRRSEVVLYLQTAAVLREQLTDKKACRADYFAKVIQENIDLLSSTVGVISISQYKPIKGWKHREAEDLAVAISEMNPFFVLGGIKQMKIDFSKVTIDPKSLNLPSIQVKPPQK